MSRDALSVKSIGRVVIVVFLVLIVISEILLYAPPASGRLTVSVQWEVAGGKLLGNTTIHAPVSATVRQTLYLIREIPSVTTVYFYFDSGYPYSYSNLVDWYGLSQHIGVVSGFRGAPINVVVLDAVQLATFLNTTPPSGQVLVVGSGVLPDTVFSTTRDTVAPWVEGGGTLIWIGDKIGTYSGVPGVPLQYPSPSNPGANGTRQFLNLSLFGGTGLYYNTSSSFATAFNLNYSLGIPYDDLNLTELPGSGGTALGNVDAGYTNLATVPLGAGRIVYFGGPTQDATNLGLLVVNLLETGLFTGQVVLINTTAVTLASGSTTTLRIDAPVPFYPFASGTVEACAFVSQTDYLALFGQTTCLPVPESEE